MRHPTLLLCVCAASALPGRWSMDSPTRGWLAHAATDFPRGVQAEPSLAELRYGLGRG